MRETGPFGRARIREPRTLRRDRQQSRNLRLVQVTMPLNRSMVTSCRRRFVPYLTGILHIYFYILSIRGPKCRLKAIYREGSNPGASADLCHRSILGIFNESSLRTHCANIYLLLEIVSREWRYGRERGGCQGYYQGRERERVSNLAM